MNLRIYLRVLRYIFAYRKVLIAALLATVGFAVFDAFTFVMLIPFLNALFGGGPLEVGSGQRAIESVLDHTIGLVVEPGAEPQTLLLWIIAFVVTTILIKNLFDFFRTYLTTVLEQAVTRDMRNEVYGHLLDMDLRFFGRTRTGQVIARLMSDVDMLRMLLTRDALKIVTSLLQLLVTLATLIAISIDLTLAAIVVLPAMFGVWRRIRRRLRRGDRHVLDLGGEVASQLQETVTGVRLVKVSAAEQFERKRFRELTQAFYRQYIKTEAVRALATPITETIAALGTVLLLWYGSYMVLVWHSIQGATFLAFLMLSLKLLSPAKYLSRVPTVVMPGIVAAERVFEFLDEPVLQRDMPNPREFQTLNDRIAFEDVSFAYVTGEPVLERVSFDLKKGEVVAVVGPSGGGKTTVVDLLARLYDPTHGRITIDGVDLREFRIASLRSRLGIVTQETILFHDTVRANIAYGLEDVAQEAIERAAKAAYAHDFIRQLPDGYDTVLGERGTRLSGGQRQRIAIARALLRDPPVLVFDEATSALDAESERLVQHAIEQLLTGRTVLVVAHRFSTIRNADRIIVLREGQIVEQGAHQELLARGGVYSQLYDFQAVGTGTA